MTENHILQMVPGGVPLVLHVSQYDAERAYILTPYYGSVKYERQPDSTAVLEATKPDSTVVAIAVTYGDDGTISFNLPASITQAAGDVRSKVSILNERGKRVSSAKIVFAVDAAGIDTYARVSESDLELLRNIEEQTEIIAENMKAVAASASAAGKSAEAAASSASAAAESERNTIQNEALLDTKVSAAAKSADTAGNSASAAAKSAASASMSEENASASARNAAGYANTASESEKAAAASALEASKSAENAENVSADLASQIGNVKLSITETGLLPSNLSYGCR